jgi:hypothetical protein
MRTHPDTNTLKKSLWKSFEIREARLKVATKSHEAQPLFATSEQSTRAVRVFM